MIHLVLFLFMSICPRSFTTVYILDRPPLSQAPRSFPGEGLSVSDSATTSILYEIKDRDMQD